MVSTTDIEITEVTFGTMTWLDIVHPDTSRVKELGERFDFHALLLEDCLTENQRPKIDDYDDYAFLVLHFPRYHKNTRQLEAAEIDVFIGPNYLITLHEGDLKPINGLANACDTKDEVRERFMSQGPGVLLCEVMRRLFDYCFPMLDKIGVELHAVQNRLHARSSDGSLLETLSKIKLEIINYRRVLKPMRPVVISMERLTRRYVSEDTDVYFDDVNDKIERIWDMLENFKEVIEALQQTYDAQTSHRLNGLMRIFTIISVVILPINVMGQLFSMNLKGIPFAYNPSGFSIFVVLTVIPTICLASLLYFKRHDWL